MRDKVLIVDDEEIIKLKPHLVNKLRKSQDGEYEKLCCFLETMEFMYFL